MSAPTWTTLRVRSISDRPAVIRALFALGAEGVQELDAEVVTCLRDVDTARAATRLRAADATAALAFEPTPSADWSSAWRSQLTARRVGRFVVTPPWLSADYTPDERIVIEPGMAFGTGDHETTRGVLRLMQPLVRRGDVVADLGAGSCVLAIAAAKLGARYVFAIENDLDAIGNAEANVQANDVAPVVSVLAGDAEALLPVVAPVRVILANIVAGVLRSLLPVMAASLSPGGRAVLGGILLDESRDMQASLRGAGWAVLDDDAEGAWWCAAIQRA